MQPSRATEVITGSFVLLGFAALFFLVTQITNRDFTFSGTTGYELTANYENIGSLKVGAPVSMAGVNIGRVEEIHFDQSIYKAVVKMRIDPQYDHIPDDSDASIMTAGLLGGQYIGVTVGGSDQYFKQGGQFQIVQDALVLENLINKLVASFAGKKDDSSSSKQESK